MDEPVFDHPEGNELCARFAVYGKVLDALRAYCQKHDVHEFVPPKTVPGYAHHEYMHFTLNANCESIILPYQLSLFNRVTTHFLNRQSYCIGPCYRLDEQAPYNLCAFNQFTFELFGEDLVLLFEHVKGLLAASFETCNINAPMIQTIDLREPSPPTDDEIRQHANVAHVPLIVMYKKKGINPLLNRPFNDELECAIELILPQVGETLDGGIRDPQILRDLYGIKVLRPTMGASFGIERMVAYIMKAQSLKHVNLP